MFDINMTSKEFSYGSKRVEGSQQLHSSLAYAWRFSIDKLQNDFANLTLQLVVVCNNVKMQNWRW